jgi:hypothetical protein
MDNESRTRRDTWILLLIHRSIDDDDSEYWMISGATDRNKGMPNLFGIRSLASEKLSNMLREKHELPSGPSASELQLIHLALGDITRAIADDAEDISIRTHAAIIMEGLCNGYNPYFDFAEEVKGLLVSVIPKVNKLCQLEILKLISYASPASPITILRMENIVDVAGGQGNTSSLCVHKRGKTSTGH